MKKETSDDNIQSLLDNFDDFLEKVRLISKNEEKREALKKAICGEETSNDEPIKEFPENTTNEQRQILNGLANEYLIKPKLTQSSKYLPMKERDIKDVIRKLYTIVPSYTHDNAFAFMTLFIETSKEGSTIQNYCREIRKDSAYTKTV